MIRSRGSSPFILHLLFSPHVSLKSESTLDSPSFHIIAQRTFSFPFVQAEVTFDHAVTPKPIWVKRSDHVPSQTRSVACFFNNERSCMIYISRKHLPHKRKKGLKKKKVLFCKKTTSNLHSKLEDSLVDALVRGMDS